MGRLLAKTMLRLIPSARAICEREKRILEGMVIFLQRHREELSHERTLDADRNLYLIDLEEKIQEVLATHKKMIYDVWRQN
jgi:hypothetical protein